MGGAPPTPPGLCTAGGPGGAIFGGSPQGPPRRREGPPRINAPGVGGGGYLPTNPPAGSDLWARRPPGEGRRPTRDPPTDHMGVGPSPHRHAPVPSAYARLKSRTGAPAGRCPSFSPKWSPGGWAGPAHQGGRTPPHPPGRASSWSRVLVLGSGGSRGDPQGCGAGPTPGVARTASPRPGGHPGGLGGTPPFRGAPDRHPWGVRGVYPPGPGSMGVNLGAGGDPPQTPPGPSRATPPPRGVRRGVLGGYRGAPRDPPRAPGGQKVHIFLGI